MTDPQQQLNKPTAKQLKFLRALADGTGQSFAWPQTSREASEEIDRLKKVKRTSRADRRRETREVSRAMATDRGDGARVRDAELAGFGSSAGWAGGAAEGAGDRGAGR